MAVSEVSDGDVVYYFRDTNKLLVQAWQSVFDDYPNSVKASHGDIFEGGPAADAIVSPANSFGFMDGGIDYAYTRFFGSQMQNRLQTIIRDDYDGELLVGQAILMPAYDEEGRDASKDWSPFNEGKAIKYLISTPTMRVPSNVADTVNVYLSFRAVLLAVRRHNNTKGNEPIRSVLVPGLATSTGRMSPLRCAWQMLQAYETFTQNMHDIRRTPANLLQVYADQEKLCEEEKYVAA
ncbi:uncharacterized protein LOC101862080 [Aplysia californica]|uniref:Uncharacterized protein LOC101862080 n=1 Tax=Aplysia californica TaxID=6500 RepID=A0ABM0K8I2_APLCA|nr:uncharacterized protein LOC101862080 [Aplysia californica]